MSDDGNDSEGESKLPPALRADPGAKNYVYRDFAHVAEEPPRRKQGKTENSIRVQKFPTKLYTMLAHSEFSDIITWMPHGRSWKVLKPNAFESLVMPLFFEYSNYHSFNRLVNAWSFRRISSGPDRGSYYHELFLRGNPHLHKHMRRLPKTHKKLPMKKSDEPDFYKLQKTSPLPDIPVSRIPTSMLRMQYQSMGSIPGTMGMSPMVAGAGGTRGNGLPVPYGTGACSVASMPQSYTASMNETPMSRVGGVMDMSRVGGAMASHAVQPSSMGRMPGLLPGMPVSMQPPAFRGPDYPPAPHPLDIADPTAQYFQNQRMRHLHHLQLFQRQTGISPQSPPGTQEEEPHLRLQQQLGYRGSFQGRGAYT